MRLFTGIAVPEALGERLVLMGGGVPRARWEPREKLHVTLRFMGDVDGGKTLRKIEDALAAIRVAPFDLALSGVGFFPPRGKPRILWVGVADPEPVIALKHSIDRALDGFPIKPDRRKYTPHLTVARLRDSPPRQVAEFLAQHSLFASETFRVDRFQLFSSVLSERGSKYRVESVVVLEETD